MSHDRVVGRSDQRGEIGTLFGIMWRSTPSAWIAPVWIFVLGMIIGFVAESGSTTGTRFVSGLLALLLFVVHLVGFGAAW